MQQVKLGRSGLSVTKIGFGGIPIMRISRDKAIRVIHRALDHGIDWIDTANGYGDSEEKIGAAIKGRDRSSIKLFTKAGGRTPEELKEQVELSLERLETDYIDLYQFHLVKSPEIWRELNKNCTVDVLLDYKSRGKIKHIGASAHQKEVAHILLDEEYIEVLQWPFNFIMEPLSQEVIDKCRSKNVGIIGMKPFGGGELDSARACIRFLMQYPDIVHNPGFERFEEVDEVVHIVNDVQEITDEDLAFIERKKKEVGTTFCRMCEYCMPCEHGVNIPLLMRVRSFLKRMTIESVTTDSFVKEMDSVELCVNCGACEECCPYDLSICERIRENAQFYQSNVRERVKK